MGETALKPKLPAKEHAVQHQSDCIKKSMHSAAITIQRTMTEKIQQRNARAAMPINVLMQTRYLPTHSFAIRAT
jgi:hypothetical protein